MERREFVKAVAGTAGLALAPLQALAAEDSAGPAFTAEQKPRPLPFNAKNLNGISEKLITSHWENNYQGAVKSYNGVRKKLAEALAAKDTPPFVYGGLKREQLKFAGSIFYHENYFGNLGGNGKAGANIRKEIGKEFGSFDNWEKEFRLIGAALGGGSGWAVLGWNAHLGRMENYWLGDHLHGTDGALPILIMDMYEHAYQMDYGAAAAKYIDAFFNNVQWEEVEHRLEKAKKLKWT
jgi:Fe-Mn family superoxide dismutase